jgi:hypothetical protein
MNAEVYSVKLFYHEVRSFFLVHIPARQPSMMFLYFYKSLLVRCMAKKITAH